MTTYYKGACHDCRQWVWLSNVGMDWAEECLEHWKLNFGHVGHDVECSSEYDEVFELRIDGQTPLEYLGYGSWKTERNGEPYKLMNEEDRFSYNMKNA